MPAATSDWLGLELANGRYLITTRLGDGGMGYVYRALDQNLGSDVVVKVPRASLLENHEFAVRFAREIRSLVCLAHPHVLKVLDVGTHVNIPFAVLQYLPGGTLRDRQEADAEGNPQPMSPTSLQPWLSGIAEALDFIHSQHYVHRDVKPDNILFDDHDIPYLGDFGVAKVVAENTEKLPKTVVTGSGMVFGTPHYMAPELIMGHKFDGKVDQYALAVTIYELLAGVYPFDGPTAPSIFVQHITDTAPELQEVAGGVPKHASDVVSRALAKDPEDRFPSCQAFATALLRAVAGLDGTKPAIRKVPTVESKRSLPCPHCGRNLVIPDIPTRRVRCAACKGSFELPSQSKNSLTPELKAGANSGVRWEEGVKPPSVRRPVTYSTTAKTQGPQSPKSGGRTTSAVGFWVWAVPVAGFLAVLLVSIFLKSSGPREIRAKQSGNPPYLARNVESSPDGPSRIQPHESSVVPNVVNNREMGEATKSIPKVESNTSSPAVSKPETSTKLPEVKTVDQSAKASFTNSVGMKLVFVPAGEFMMGSPNTEKGHESREGPQHKIRISTAYYLASFECRQREYAKVMGNNPSAFKDPDKPVERVLWSEAMEFCRRLSALPEEKLAGRNYRLPTEAEWEYACRAGTKTPFHVGDSLSANLARFSVPSPTNRNRGPTLKGTVKVGTYQPNPFGLFDMHGNVDEWVLDLLGDGYYATSPNMDPRGPPERNPGSPSGSFLNIRIRRGGNWSDPAIYCRSAHRAPSNPNERSDAIGFRVLCEK